MSFITFTKSVSFTATMAVLSAGWLVSTSAHAGLLGGGGALGGGFGGSFTPHTLEIGGNATGQVQRDPVALPRGDRAKDAAANATAQGSGKVDGALSRGAANARSAQASVAGEAAAARATDKPDTHATPPAVPSTAPGATTGAKPVSTSSAQGGAGLATRHAETSATGSALASRNDSRISADGAANASMQR